MAHLEWGIDMKHICKCPELHSAYFNRKLDLLVLMWEDGKRTEYKTKGYGYKFFSKEQYFKIRVEGE